MFGLQNIVFCTLFEILKINICNFISLALVIIDFKIIMIKFQNLANLFKTQVFYIYKTIKNFIICKYKKFIFTTF